MTDYVIEQTTQGRIRGVRDRQALRFLGIPYAQSPSTAGRFAAPVPHGRWDGTRDALVYGATSPQPDRGITVIPEPIIAGDNELNLNIFTPELGPAGLPVLVWIHGGGFFGGGNASPWYRGGPFARDGVVLVSINYRLGAEGFLEVPGVPANRAVRDWVRAGMGPGEHRGVRRGSGPGDDRGAVSRRWRLRHAARRSRSPEPVPSRGVHEWRGGSAAYQ